jgi:hypothetical protein
MIENDLISLKLQVMPLEYIRISNSKVKRVLQTNEL